VGKFSHLTFNKYIRAKETAAAERHVVETIEYALPRAILGEATALARALAVTSPSLRGDLLSVFQMILLF